MMMGQVSLKTSIFNAGPSVVEAMFAGETQALTRFANNAIHQNVAEQTAHLCAARESAALYWPRTDAQSSAFLQFRKT